MRDQLQAERALDLVKQLARFTKDGDQIDHDDGEGPQEWLAEGNDDEIDALYSMVSAARAIVDDRPEGFVEEENETGC